MKLGVRWSNFLLEKSSNMCRFFNKWSRKCFQGPNKNQAIYLVWIKKGKTGILQYL
jgi:hypothetical protein